MFLQHSEDQEKMDLQTGRGFYFFPKDRYHLFSFRKDRATSDPGAAQKEAQAVCTCACGTRYSN